MPQRRGVLALDVGTTSTKAVLFDVAGAVVASSTHEYPLVAPRPGWAVQDPDLIVTAALDAIGVVAAAARGRQVAVVGLAVSTMMHSLLALDARHRPLTPSLTWADGRAASQAERLRADPAGRRLAHRSGTPVHPMSPLLKLIWFREEQPETFAAARYWVGIKEYVLLRLCGGGLQVDRSVASATGLYDVLAGDWDGDALRLAGVRRDQLATLVACTDQAGTITAAVAGRTGLPAGTPVIAGASDGALASVGVGAVSHGTVACSIGTSGALRSTVDRPAVDPSGRVFCYALDDTHWIVGGATNNGGNVLRWMHSALAPELPAESADRTLVELAGQAPPGSAGLLMLPYLAGERAPHWRGNPRGVYFGLTHQHRREHLVRAGLEAVCLQLALVLRAMGDAGFEANAVRATGGFARSPLWRQMLADALGRPIGFPRTHEGSALGAAIVGMRALGIVDSLDIAADLVPVVQTESPTSAADVYARLFPLYSALYDTFEPAFDALGHLAGELPGSPTPAPSAHPVHGAPGPATGAES
jgi:gluconokinase